MKRSDGPGMDENTASDDITTSDDIFNRISDVPERTFQEKLQDNIQTYIVVPGRIIAGDIRGLIGGSILIGVLLMGTAGVYFVPGPTTMRYPPLTPPFQSMDYPLGTGALGQEVHRQIIHATPSMLKMVFAGALISVIIGTVVGTVAGYKSGMVDYYLMMVSDTFLSIPAIVLVMVLAATYQPRSPYIVGIILGINFWPTLARTVRSETLSLREESVIEAARVMGLSDWYIVRKYAIKNLMPYITVNTANSARAVIFESVALYFIGVLPYEQSNWGVMMDQAYSNSDLMDISQLHWLIVPMMMIVVFTLGITLTAQAMDSLFNVKLRARHESDEETSRPLSEETS